MAYLFACAWLKRARTSSPTIYLEEVVVSCVCHHLMLCEELDLACSGCDALTTPVLRESSRGAIVSVLFVCGLLLCQKCQLIVLEEISNSVIVGQCCCWWGMWSPHFHYGRMRSHIALLINARSCSDERQLIEIRLIEV